MQKIATSDELVDKLVRTCVGVEPGTMAALAQGDVQVRLSDVPALQHVANQAGADVASLIAAGEIERAAGASRVMIAAMLLRAAAPAGGEGVPAATDLAIKALTAEKLDEVGATVAAAMVRAVVAFERGAEAGAPLSSGARW